MIKSFKAQNFRCFRGIELPDLRRINIVVGRNATGKTALLEVLRLGLGGTPSVLWSLNQYRAFYPFVAAPLSREQFEAQWNPYFFNFDPSHEISTECYNYEGQRAALRIFYDPEKPVTQVPQQQPIASPVGTIIPLAFDRTDFGGIESRLYASIGPQGQFPALDQGAELGVASEFFASTWFYNAQQNATWFSQLSVQNREKEVVAAVRKEWPFVEDLTVLSPHQVGAVYATISHLREKLPLSLVSAGINKFFTVLASIVARGHGAILVDEIDNGLYYEGLESMWENIYRLTKEHDTQLFATTHSLECVRALLPVMKGHEDDFTLLRAEKNNGVSGVTPVKGRYLEAALEQNFEVR
jgi:hypothetical protein